MESQLLATTPDGAMAVVQVVTQLGLAVSLVVFFVYRDWAREKREEKKTAEREARQAADASAREERLNARINGLEEFQRTTLIALGNKAIATEVEATAAIQRSTTALKHNTEAFRGLMQKMA